MVEINGIKYKLIFTTKAYKGICEKFGSYGEFCDVFGKMGAQYSAVDCANIAWLIALLANQAIMIKNYENKTKEPLIEAEYIELKTKPRDLTSMNLQAVEAINEGWKSQAEKTEETDEVLDEIKKTQGAQR